MLPCSRTISPMPPPSSPGRPSCLLPKACPLPLRMQSADCPLRSSITTQGTNQGKCVLKLHHALYDTEYKDVKRHDATPSSPLHPPAPTHPSPLQYLHGVVNAASKVLGSRMCLARHLPAKKFVPLDMVPVCKQHLFLSPLGQEVAPVLTGLLAVAPQLLRLACVISHHETVHLQKDACHVTARKSLCCTRCVCSAQSSCMTIMHNV